MTATYNITNDKLKLWPEARLSESEYAEAKSHKFTWWPGSKCFCAKWSPGAEDFITGLGYTIEDDDAPDDVESRVDRYQGYAERSESASSSAAAYLESERCNTERRRKNAANGVERNLESAEHWHRRVEGAIRHAAYKERTDVIGRRILGLEADLRKTQKILDQAVALSVAWQNPDLTLERAKHITNYYDHTSHCFTKDKYPASKYDGPRSLWSALNDGLINHEQAREIAMPAHDRTIAWATRWVMHIEDRLVYEKTVYFAQGGTEEQLHPPRRKGKTAIPLLNLEQQVVVKKLYERNASEALPVQRMTKAELSEIGSEMKGTSVSACGTFRVRTALFYEPGCRSKIVQVFLTDSKKHEIPDTKGAAA